VDQPASLADSTEFFAQSFFEPPAVNPYGLSDAYDAKHLDLQTASGATHVSDEALAAEV
jgi:transcriptional activator HAC1